jgi:thiamine-phosphate pyrophosphorylase
MHSRQTLPRLWLVTDRRNDAALEAALRRLPRGSGLIFRHYHLEERSRWQRFAKLMRVARGRGLCVVLAGDLRMARRWGADGAYGPARQLRGGSPGGLLRLATAHDLREIGMARRAGADAVLLSPVFLTRSHADSQPLGSVRFRLIASQAGLPVIALGGMSERAARRLRWPRWAAIDGLSRPGG